MHKLVGRRRIKTVPTKHKFKKKHDGNMSPSMHQMILSSVQTIAQMAVLAKSVQQYLTKMVMD